MGNGIPATEYPASDRILASLTFRPSRLKRGNFYTIGICTVPFRQTAQRLCDLLDSGEEPTDLRGIAPPLETEFEFWDDGGHEGGLTFYRHQQTSFAGGPTEIRYGLFMSLADVEAARSQLRARYQVNGTALRVRSIQRMMEEIIFSPD